MNENRPAKRRAIREAKVVELNPSNGPNRKARRTNIALIRRFAKKATDGV